MDYIAQMMLDPNQERVVTIKTKPEAKKDKSVEAPISPYSANLPQNIIDLVRGETGTAPVGKEIGGEIIRMLLEGGKKAFSGFNLADFQSAMRQSTTPSSMPISAVLQNLGVLQGQDPAPQGMIPAAPQFDPMAGQQPMDFSAAPSFNPYGG